MAFGYKSQTRYYMATFWRRSGHFFQDFRGFHSTGKWEARAKDAQQKPDQWVLTIIPDAYGEEKGQMRSMLIKTLAATLKQDPKLDREGMIEALRQNDPEDLQTNAAACVRAQGGRALTYMVEIQMRSYHAAVRRSTTTGRSLLTAMAGYDPPPLCRGSFLWRCSHGFRIRVANRNDRFASECPAKYLRNLLI